MLAAYCRLPLMPEVPADTTVVPPHVTHRPEDVRLGALQLLAQKVSAVLERSHGLLRAQWWSLAA
jgi:hypothetical protein